MLGIVSYGFYVPRNRITVEEIAKAYGKTAAEIKASLKITEKAVAGTDEDSVSMAFAAAQMALSDAPLDPEEIDVVLFGSETHPYAVKPASTIVAEWLGVGNNRYLAYDTQFACKAATGALFSAFSAVKAKDARFGLVCGVDKASGKPGDTLEYTAGSGAVALVVGSKNVLLEAIDYTSFASDTPDFWRRHGISHPSHGGRFTGKPAYFRHVYESSTELMRKTNLKPEDFARAVFHMPNGRFPVEVSRMLGFTPEQIEKSLVVSRLGNSYAASALMGLVSTLEHAREGDLIFFASYGSGAGSDAIVFRVTGELERRRREFASAVEDKHYIDYTTYLRYMHILS
jgi:hydroxymethylglutaryl-CoA synthase